MEALLEGSTEAKKLELVLFSVHGGLLVLLVLLLLFLLGSCRDGWYSTLFEQELDC